MKCIGELTKEELVGLVLNNIDIGIKEEQLECAVCGVTAEAKFYYICDNCSGLCEDKGNTITTSDADSFDFLNDAGEDIYTISDGKPI